MDEPSGDQTHRNTEDSKANALPPAQPDALALSADEMDGSNGTQDGRQKSSGSSRGLLSRLTSNEWLTLLVGVGSVLVGVGSLVVSYLTYRNAADTSDIKTAIGNLSELATQTKRQADAMQDQLGAVRDQVKALRDQAQEAKHQTAAIASQTEAIKASSEAAVRSAEANISSAVAQRRMAEVTAQAQKPNVDILELKVTDMNKEPDKDGIVHPTLIWKFRDTGGSSLTVKGLSFGVWPGDALPKVMPDQIYYDGQGLVLTNSSASAFYTEPPTTLRLPKETRDAINRGDVKLFFFARFDYLDNMGNEHSSCFGREFKFYEGNSIAAFPSGGEAYQCST